MAKSILVIDDETMPGRHQDHLRGHGILGADDLGSAPGHRRGNRREFRPDPHRRSNARTNGAEVTEAVLARKPGARILVITAYPNDPLAERAIKAGAVGLLKKPFEIAKILDFLA